MNKRKPTTTDTRHLLGHTGEALAAHYLKREGYTIVQTRFRTRHGEVDLIAKKGNLLIFVEVKARSSPRFGSSIDAVDVRKVLRLSRVAQAYLERYTWRGDWQIDVIGLEFSPNGTLLTLEHLPDITL